MMIPEQEFVIRVRNLWNRCDVTVTEAVRRVGMNYYHASEEEVFRLWSKVGQNPFYMLDQFETEKTLGSGI